MRIATVLDRPLFEFHLRAFLDERHAAGSFILPTSRTIDFYLSLFDAYTQDKEPGVVVISDHGTSIAGHTLPFDTTYGKTATGWFTYVAPDARGHGEASKLRAVLRESLILLGYQAVAFGVDADNEAGKVSISSRPIQWTQLYGIEGLV